MCPASLMKYILKRLVNSDTYMKSNSPNLQFIALALTLYPDQQASCYF